MPGKETSLEGILGRVLDHIVEGAVVVDLSSRAVLAVNGAYLEQSGYDDELDALTLELARLYDLKDLERILTAASQDGFRDTVVPGVSCLRRDGDSFTADLKMISLGRGTSALILLLYRPPAASVASPDHYDLSKFTLTLAGVRTIDGLGAAVTEAARGLMKTETMLLIAQSAHAGSPDVVISTGLSPEAQDRTAAWLENLIGSGLLSIETPRVVLNVQEEERLGEARQALLASRCKACVVFALENEGRVAGAWLLGYSSSTRAECCDLRSGQAFASHLSVNLAGALLLERTRREKRHHEVLNRVINWLRGPFELKDILGSLTTELCRVLEADRCLILSTAGTDDESDAQLKVLAQHCEEPLLPLDETATIKFGGTSLGGAVLYSKEPLAVDDLPLRPDLSEDHEEIIQRLGLRGTIISKIVSRHVVIGLVAVTTSRSARRWTREEIDLVRAVADHVAITLETARLAISSRERAEQIERERREWERTFDAIPDMLAIHDGYGRLLRANLALQVRLGGDPRKFIGKECGDLFTTVIGHAEGCPHDEALAQRRSISREIQGKNGSFAVTAIPCFDAAGRCLYIIHVCREVTEEKQIREQLLQSEKMAAVGSLVSGVAHELNNPLTGVIGFSELLLGTQEDPQLKKSLQRIHDEANRASRIVRNLLTFARKHKPESIMVNLNTVLEKTIDLRSYELRVKTIKVVTELSTDLPKTLADPNQLVQVFMNIITNAEHAMREAHGKGTLTIRTARNRDTIQIQFQDDGPGIAPQHLQKVFDPFFTTKPVGQGTGLGLSICDGILKEHGGSIAATSAVGQGTTFTITLPIVQGAESSVRPDKTPARKRTPGRVLVVDDEPFIRDLVQSILAGRGHAVDGVDGGHAALKRLAADPYDLIISDLRMPELDGQQLFARIKTEHPDLARRVLFISGDSVSSETRSFLDTTGQPYVFKPFKAQDLIDEAEKLMESTRPSATPPEAVH